MIDYEFFIGMIEIIIVRGVENFLKLWLVILIRIGEDFLMLKRMCVYEDY